MNQEEKCRKEVAREENKRRLIFFFTSGFHWDSDFTGSRGASATAGAALLQRKETM